MQIFRPLSSVDSNAEPSALYTLANIHGEAHTIVIGAALDRSNRESWQITVHRGMEDEILDWDPIGVVYAESEDDARTIAEALIRSNLYLLPFFDAIDTAIHRLDFAYGDTAISQLFTVDPVLAIAV